MFLKFFCFFMIFNILLLYVFVNSLYYAISLLLFSFSSIMIMVLCNYLLPITGIIIMLIYAGAMMILIGYVCAVNPNISLKSNTISFFVLFFLFVVMFISLEGSFSVFFSGGAYSSFFYSTAGIASLSDFFYTYVGIIFFMLVILMLFLTILMVTTQYLAPKGPFRSI